MRVHCGKGNNKGRVEGQQHPLQLPWIPLNPRVQGILQRMEPQLWDDLPPQVPAVPKERLHSQACAVGWDTHLQCLFGNGVFLQAGDDFQHRNHVPDL